jgi:putative transposase
MPEKFKNIYRIDSTRLKGWDYGTDADYFVTICTKDKKHHFGKIINGEMLLSSLGKEVLKCWLEIPEHFPFADLDEFVIMPNHIHFIVTINKETLTESNNIKSETQDIASLLSYKNRFAPQSNNLSSIIRGFKIGVTKYAKQNNMEFRWQTRFYEHIIKNNDEYISIKNYIITNPVNWQRDEMYS